jgi:predicted  nucleic acid-binding Zn-ribbon protein
MFAPPDKEKLGNRYSCFECGTKFYDLLKPEPLCPECGADQRLAPKRDLKALLESSRRSRPNVDDEDRIDDDESDSDDELADDFLDEDEDEDDEPGEDDEEEEEAGDEDE